MEETKQTTELPSFLDEVPLEEQRDRVIGGLTCCAGHGMEACERNCPYARYGIMCISGLSKDTLNYIEKLHANIDEAVRDFTRLETLHKIKDNQLEAKDERIAAGASGTAAEIYEAIRPLLMVTGKRYGDDPATLTANELFIKKVKEVFEPYGVEVKL